MLLCCVFACWSQENSTSAGLALPESLQMGGGASKSTAKDADGIFKKIDANGDGKLSVNELAVAAMQ